MQLEEIRRHAKSEGMKLHPLKTRAFYLNGYDFAPTTVFDIGVHDGTPWLYRSFPEASFVLIDPQPECGELVRASGKLEQFDFHAVALGASEGEATLNVPQTEPGKGGAMASLLERRDPLADSFQSVTQQKVAVRRLDDLAAQYDGPYGIKIDTEGFEVPILQGAEETLKRADFVILELSVTQRFDQSFKPSEATGLLARAGLELRDVLSVADGPGRRAKPRHMDALFTRWAA